MGRVRRRFGALLGALRRSEPGADGPVRVEPASADAPTTGTLRIGNVSAPLEVPERPELVPANFGLLNGEAAETARHLRWIMQKDLNKQDVFLIGPPGPLKRRLAMLYCELRQREVEYLCLSRDTTESDLKQRREILPETHCFLLSIAVTLQGADLQMCTSDKSDAEMTLPYEMK